MIGSHYDWVNNLRRCVCSCVGNVPRQETEEPGVVEKPHKPVLPLLFDIESLFGARGARMIDELLTL